jgi:hypothetical protein
MALLCFGYAIRKSDPLRDECDVLSLGPRAGTPPVC